MEERSDINDLLVGLAGRITDIEDIYVPVTLFVTRNPSDKTGDGEKKLLLNIERFVKKDLSVKEFVKIWEKSNTAFSASEPSIN